MPGGIDYHIEVEKHLYSVPHTLLRQEVEVRLTAGTIEVFARGKRVAAHVRTAGRGRPTTVADHMPSSHRRYADWTLERIHRDASAIGPASAASRASPNHARPRNQQAPPGPGHRQLVGIARRPGPGPLLLIAWTSFTPLEQTQHPTILYNLQCEDVPCPFGR